MHGQRDTNELAEIYMCTVIEIDMLIDVLDKQRGKDLHKRRCTEYTPMER